ncbi:uncharacterized protein LOC126298467 [Schistocerca gregaria]|uniref:uncharacterized protein LOC126298467 n=1 Tax=Schistocerca gregaria TaxID=7010 RepID=UPI00211E9662|nr:uncharacterized protein LOC126298467 [Schistocerca gregaria]
MSSQAADEPEVNGIMCYFPWLPYYRRYQIGFDIIVNAPNAQQDSSLAGESQRLIHVGLCFPDGFICEPAHFGGVPNPSSFRADAPYFYPPHPHFHPPMYPVYPHATPPFHHHVSMDSHGPMMWQEQRDSRVTVYVVNGEPGEFMTIDDAPCEVIKQCEMCREFHRKPEHIQKKKSERVRKRRPSKQLHKESRHPCQLPSTSGTTGHRDTWYAAPFTASETVATDTTKHLQNQDERKLSQQMGEEHQHGPHDGVQGIQDESDTDSVTSVSSQSTASTITEEKDCLGLDGQNNDLSVLQAFENLSTDPDVNNDN